MKAQIINSQVRDGISAKSGKAYKMTTLTCVVTGPDGKMSAGRIRLFGDQPIFADGGKYELNIETRLDAKGDLTFVPASLVPLVAAK